MDGFRVRTDIATARAKLYNELRKQRRLPLVEEPRGASSSSGESESNFTLMERIQRALAREATAHKVSKVGSFTFSISNYCKVLYNSPGD